MCDLEAIGAPSISKTIRSAASVPEHVADLEGEKKRQKKALRVSAEVRQRILVILV